MPIQRTLSVQKRNQAKLTTCSQPTTLNLTNASANTIQAGWCQQPEDWKSKIAVHSTVTPLRFFCAVPIQNPRCAWQRLPGTLQKKKSKPLLNLTYGISFLLEPLAPTSTRLLGRLPTNRLFLQEIPPKLLVGFRLTSSQTLLDIPQKVSRDRCHHVSTLTEKKTTLK